MYVYHIFISALTVFLFKSIIYKYNWYKSEGFSPVDRNTVTEQPPLIISVLCRSCAGQAYPAEEHVILGSVLCDLSQEQKEAVYLHTPKIAET